jgi:hypothetical protein
VAFPDAGRCREYRCVRGSKDEAPVNVLKSRCVGAFETADLVLNEQYLGEDGRIGSSSV